MCGCVAIYFLVRQALVAATRAQKQISSPTYRYAFPFFCALHSPWIPDEREYPTRQGHAYTTSA